MRLYGQLWYSQYCHAVCIVLYTGIRTYIPTYTLTRTQQLALPFQAAASTANMSSLQTFRAIPHNPRQLLCCLMQQCLTQYILVTGMERNVNLGSHKVRYDRPLVPKKNNKLGSLRVSFVIAKFRSKAAANDCKSQ